MKFMHGEGSFILITAIVVGGILCGYLLRRTGLFEGRARKHLSLIAMVTTYPVVGFLSIWRMTLQKEFSILPLILVVWMILLIAVGWIFSYIHRLSRADRGVFICACGLSNLGFTMGGLVCYSVYGPQGLGLNSLYLLFWNPVIVLTVFPIAHYFSPHSTQQSLGRVIWHGIWHIRSVAMLGAVAGIVFSLREVPYPSWLDKYRVLQILMIVGTFTAFAIIGLSLHLSKLREYTRLYISHAGFRFLISPLLALLMVVLFGLDLSELPAKVLLTLGFMPAAVYTVFIANLFDLNAKLASAMFVVNTAVFLIVVLPILLIFAS